MNRSLTELNSFTVAEKIKSGSFDSNSRISADELRMLLQVNALLERDRSTFGNERRD